MSGLAAEALRAQKGGWLILRGRTEEAFALFNLTEAGFWRSFAAIVLVAPVYLLAARLGIPAQGAASAQGRAVVGVALLTGVLVLALQWVSWPLLMVFVTRALGLSRHYARYIIIYNWSTVLIFLVQLPPVALYACGCLDQQGAAFFMLAVLAAVLYFRWRVARAGLEAPPATALMLVLMDLAVSMGINRLFL